MADAPPPPPPPPPVWPCASMLSVPGQYQYNLPCRVALEGFQDAWCSGCGKANSECVTKTNALGWSKRWADHLAPKGPIPDPSSTDRSVQQALFPKVLTLLRAFHASPKVAPRHTPARWAAYEFWCSWLRSRLGEDESGWIAQAAKIDVQADELTRLADSFKNLESKRRRSSVTADKPPKRPRGRKSTVRAVEQGDSVEGVTFKEAAAPEAGESLMRDCSEESDDAQADADYEDDVILVPVPTPLAASTATQARAEPPPPKAGEASKVPSPAKAAPLPPPSVAPPPVAPAPSPAPEALAKESAAPRPASAAPVAHMVTARVRGRTARAAQTAPPPSPTPAAPPPPATLSQAPVVAAAPPTGSTTAPAAHPLLKPSLVAVFRQLNLERLLPRFAKEEIFDVATAAALQDGDFDRLSLPLGTRVALRQAFKEALLNETLGM